VGNQQRSTPSQKTGFESNADAQKDEKNINPQKIHDHAIPKNYSIYTGRVNFYLHIFLHFECEGLGWN
jgi:hypothetical protein